MPDIRNIAIWLLLALAVTGWGVGCAERTRTGALAKDLKTARDERDIAQGERAGLVAAVNQQKTLVAEQYRAAQASVLAQQRRLDDLHAQQEKTDAQNSAVVADLRGRLRAERLRAESLAAADSRRGRGDPTAAGEAAARAGAGAGGATQAGRILPAAVDGPAAEEDDAYDADLLNIAYATCRARVMATAPAQ